MSYTLEQLNAITDEAFVATLGGIFEHSPWVARQAAAARPFSSVEVLHGTMVAAVAAASPAQQLALIRAHPELAGKAAVQAQLTAESTREQASAGLGQCSQEDFDKLGRLNAAYLKKFGFPFILAVRGYDRPGIIANLEARLDNERKEELRMNLEQVYRISRFRLDDLLEDGSNWRTTPMARSILDPNAPDFTRRYTNLADPRLGAEALDANDEFFAPKDRMLSPEPAVFIEGKYDDHGKWMDGWETRRKRTAGYDWCIVKLARAGVVHGVDIDTSHFTGNFPPAASIEAARIEGGSAPDASTQWAEIVASTTLKGNSHHYIDVRDGQAYTHVRLNIYPDGGVARLRVYGQPNIEWAGTSASELVDLAAMGNGAYVVAANNEHFGAASSLLLPGRGVNMGDGWETRRRREPGNDWAIIALARRGTIKKIEVDTAHFKGNYPDRCSIQAASHSGGTDSSIVTQAMFWPTLLDEQKLEMDKQHCYEGAQIAALGPVTHVRLNIFPDGGVSRLRVWGVID